MVVSIESLSHGEKKKGFVYLKYTLFQTKFQNNSKQYINIQRVGIIR